METKDFETIAKTLIEFSDMFNTESVFKAIAKDIADSESIIPDELELVKYAFKKVLKKYNDQMEICKKSTSNDMLDLIPKYRESIEKLQAVFSKL